MSARESRFPPAPKPAPLDGCKPMRIELKPRADGYRGAELRIGDLVRVLGPVELGRLHALLEAALK